MQKNAYYFSHDSNARNDEKMLMLRAEHGMEGYGIFWVLVEMMFEDNDTQLAHSRVKGIAVSCNTDAATLLSVISTAIAEGLFESDNTFFWSNSLRRRKGKFEDIREKKSAAGKMGMSKRWNSPAENNDVITDDNRCYNSDITKNNKVKEMKGNKIKEDSSTEINSVKPARNINLVDDALLAMLEKNEAYTGINIRREYGKMLAWIETPKGRGKMPTKARFINWLNRATPCDAKPAAPKQATWTPEF